MVLRCAVSRTQGQLLVQKVVIFVVKVEIRNRKSQNGEKKEKKDERRKCFARKVGKICAQSVVGDVEEGCRWIGILGGLGGIIMILVGKR